MAIIDPQVALLLLHRCGSFSKLVHLARTTPTALVFEDFQRFDADVNPCFSNNCIADYISDTAWHKAQLSIPKAVLALLSFTTFLCGLHCISLFFWVSFRGLFKQLLVLMVWFFQVTQYQSHLYLHLLQDRDFCPQS